MSERLIAIEHLSASYDKRSMVLQDVSLTLFADDFLGITGPNGGGKTTLLKVILGLQPLAAGHIRFFEGGRETNSLKTGYLPQMNLLDKKFPISVREVIASGMMSEKPLFRSLSKEQNKQIDRVMEQMGLENLGKQPVGELSGGQLQRTLLGRAIVSRPRVLILDEPGSYVDKEFESHFFQLLDEINKESAIILVSHDLRSIEGLAKHIAYVNRTLTVNTP